MWNTAEKNSSLNLHDNCFKYLLLLFFFFPKLSILPLILREKKIEFHSTFQINWKLSDRTSLTFNHKNIQNVGLCTILSQFPPGVMGKEFILPPRGSPSRYVLVLMECHHSPIMISLLWFWLRLILLSLKFFTASPTPPSHTTETAFLDLLSSTQLCLTPLSKSYFSQSFIYSFAIFFFS